MFYNPPPLKKVTEENILRMFEGKVIRKIYAPMMENNIWRIR
jgi:hypothetical protein